MANLGMVHLRMGDSISAVQRFDTALRVRPDLLDVRFLLGLALYQAGEFDKSRHELEIFLRAKPNDGRALHLDGLCLLKLGALAQGAAALERAVQANPANQAAVLTLATTYVSLGETGNAQALADGPLSQGPPAAAKLIRGMILNVQGKYRDAERELTDAVRLDSKLATAHNQLGYARMLLGNNAEAVLEFKKELDIAPNDFNACANLGWLLVQQREFDRAEPFLEEALRQRGGNAGLLYLAGQVKLIKRDLPGAAAALERAVARQPEFRAAHVLLTRVYARQNRRKDVEAQSSIIATLTAAEQERNLESTESYGSPASAVPVFSDSKALK